MTALIQISPQKRDQFYTIAFRSGMIAGTIGIVAHSSLVQNLTLSFAGAAFASACIIMEGSRNLETSRITRVFCSALGLGLGAAGGFFMNTRSSHAHLAYFTGILLPTLPSIYERLQTAQLRS